MRPSFSHSVAGFTISTPSATKPIGPARYERATDDYVAIFEQKLAQWKADAEPLSSVKDKMSLPAFQFMVSMGPKIIPLIIRDLRSNPSFIFLALPQLARVNPVPASATGKPKEMIRAWLDWADDAGYGPN